MPNYTKKEIIECLNDNWKEVPVSLASQYFDSNNTNDDITIIDVIVNCKNPLRKITSIFKLMCRISNTNQHTIEDISSLFNKIMECETLEDLSGIKKIITDEYSTGEQVNINSAELNLD